MDNLFKTSDGIEYEIDNLGVIHQLNPEPFNYNQNYIDGYRSPEYKEKSALLMGVRMGCVISSYNHIFQENPVSILDFGYGDGSFLKVASQFIKKTFGFDVSPEPTPEDSIKVDNLKDHYSVITFWDALEHVKDLDFVENLKANMIVISLPNVENKNFDNWKHRKPNEHLHHFTPRTLSLFMLSKGWTEMSSNNMEDIVRKGEKNNILTSVFIRL